MVINSTSIPPSTGTAIGLITSLPVLVDHIIGTSANIVVAVVMITGRILREPPPESPFLIHPNFLANDLLVTLAYKSS